MQDNYSVNQDLSLNEYFRFTLYLLPRTKIIKRLFIFLTILGLLSGLMGLLAPGENEKPDFIAFLPSLMAPVFLSAFFFVFSFLACVFIVKFKPHIIQGNTFQFTHWGMERTSSGQVAAIPWRDIQTLKETRSFFVFYVTENKIQNIHVIQKRMFTSSGDAERFREFVEGNLILESK